MSRDPVDPSIVGIFEDMTVWADVEGAPEGSLHRLKVLKGGTLVEADAFNPGNARDWALTWASSGSFQGLNRLCREFLGWDNFSVRSFKPRAIFEWGLGDPHYWRLGEWARVVCRCDGPLVDVVTSARQACAAMEVW